MTPNFQVSNLTHAEQIHLSALSTQLVAKQRRNVIRTGFYDMKNSATSLFADAVPSFIKQREFVLGWSAIAVDKLNRRCNLERFYSPTGEDLADFGLDDLIEGNRLLSELSQAGTNSLIHAASFLVTLRGDTAAGEPPVLVMAKDAASATGIWDSRRRALRSFLSVEATNDVGEPTSLLMILPGVVVAMTKVPGDWRVTRRPYNGELPVDVLRYKPRLGRPFGSSRISRAVMSIHSQALSAMIRADVNGEAYSLPRYVVLGATESSFKDQDGKPKPAWRAAWDAVWALGDDEDMAQDPEASRWARADVKQFTGQSPEPQNAQLRMLAQMFSGETGIPIGELGIIGDSNPTSEGAQTVSREDIVSEAETTTDNWSPDISRTVNRALALLNGGDAPKVRPQWRNPQHVSRSAAADAGLKMVQAMPSLAQTDVALELIGLSPSQIERVRSEMRRSDSRAVLEGIAEASKRMTPAEIKAASDAMGTLIRSGVEPADAAGQVGLDGIRFTGAVPVALRMPESDASSLESR